MNDASQVLDNSEIIAITSKLLLIAAIFQISDGIQVVVLGALRGLQDVKFPCTLPLVLGHRLSYFLLFEEYADSRLLESRTLGRINSGSYFLYIRFARLTKS
jgi:MATE family multidrug resistance protein